MLFKPKFYYVLHALNMKTGHCSAKGRTDGRGGLGEQGRGTGHPGTPLNPPLSVHQHTLHYIPCI